MRKASLVFSFLLINVCSFAQVMSSQQIDSLAEKVRTAFDVPGIAVAVIKDGKIVHSKGYGVRSLHSNQPVDDHTLFGIASNTKAFTAAALGILVDEGKLQWDDKVIKYLPDFQLHDTWVTKEFTIRDLLTHRSGLGLGAGDLMVFPDSSNFTKKEIIHNLRYLKPVSSFRTKYDYDNLLYMVAGEVVEKVGGKSWEDFIEQRIMQPLGMVESAATYTRLKNKTNVIDAHASVEDKVQVIDRYIGSSLSAAGRIYSSATDLSKWILMQLARGKHGENGSKQLISEKLIKEMWYPQTIEPSRAPGVYNTHFWAYGLGFHVSDVKGYLQLDHGGALPGMLSQITMLPELNLGIVVLTNQQEGSALRAITNTIKDGYLNMPVRDLVKTYGATRKRNLESAKHITDSIWNAVVVVQQQNSKNINVTPYLGTYNDAWLGDVIISMKDGKTWFTSKRSPKLTGEVFPYKDNMFIVKWRDRSMDADAFVIFSKEKDGKKIGMTMKPISPLTDFSYDFQDLSFTKIK